MAADTECRLASIVSQAFTGLLDDNKVTFHSLIMEKSEGHNSTSALKLVVRIILYLAFSTVVFYLLAFVALVFVPGLGNKLRTIGVDEALLEKVFYPLLRLIS